MDVGIGQQLADEVNVAGESEFDVATVALDKVDGVAELFDGAGFVGGLFGVGLL